MAFTWYLFHIPWHVAALEESMKGMRHNEGMTIANLLHARYGFKDITYLNHFIQCSYEVGNPITVFYFSGEGTETAMGQITPDCIASKWWGWNHAPLRNSTLALLTLRMCQVFFKVSSMPQILIRCPIYIFICY
ncbi:hypothetical protein HJG60_007936 [Phyllostomus discolor]|uniref:Uncharacterized protein n=1 Tax=Phyllostomus discolor TaxID=89673 RepID=A0A834BHV9_9CHIR|nr:hypothetical protein HJG60_007936 [Phyllostomus discolor]